MASARSRGWLARGRRTWRACVLAAVAASVAGCVGMPNSGSPGTFSATPQDTSQDNAPPPGQQTAVQQELRPEDAARLLEAIRERGREVDNQRQQRRAKTRATQVEKDW